MKRQGGNAGGQPPIKKPDASTDLRSTIGAKLQRLLNTDTVLCAKRRKQLYEDLFGKPKYSEIIIDPTIVIKEEPDDEECNNDSSTLLNSQNFLISAKNRLTELLNKQQDGANKYKDNGKENSLFCSKNKSSSSKSSSLQSPSCSKSPSRLCNSSNKKRNSTNKEHLSSSTDPVDNEVHLKQLVIVVEDCMNSNLRTESLPSNHLDSNANSLNLESNCVSKKDGHLISPSKIVNKKTNRTSKSCTNSKTPASEYSSIENNSEMSRSKSCSSPGFVFSNDPSPSKLNEYAEVLQDTDEYINQVPYYSEDESEMIDDPIIPQVIVDIKVGESMPNDVNLNFENENSDSEVELLCVKKPTHEVITLEDNGEDEEEICVTQVPRYRKSTGPEIEFIHECKQCGKSFRAESLLNFHVRMHGNTSFQSPASMSHSYS